MCALCCLNKMSLPHNNVVRHALTAGKALFAWIRWSRTYDELCQALPDKLKDVPDEIFNFLQDLRGFTYLAHGQTLRNFWWSLALDFTLRVHSRDTKCQLKYISRVLLYTNHPKLWSFCSSQNAMKVCAFILDTYIRHWHLCVCSYLTHHW